MNAEKGEPLAGSQDRKPAPRGQREPPVIRSEDLFQACRELVIVHDGQEYRLRLTRQNKLILTK